jgi:hypothetical protein
MFQPSDNDASGPFRTLQTFWRRLLPRPVCSRLNERRRRRRPCLEALEDRTLLSVQMLSHYNGLDFYSSGYSYPPDTVGAAGPTSYIETVNATVAIYTPKNTGARCVSDSLFHFFWGTGGLPHASANSDLSDASMVWDDQIQRFIVADHDVDGNTGASRFDIAISKSAGPATLTTADWAFYSFDTTQHGFFSDYEGNLGYNHDAFVWTFNMYDSSGNFNHVEINTVSISDLVAELPSPTYVLTQMPSSSGDNWRPTVMHHSMAGDPMWFVQDSVTGFSTTTIKVIKEVDPLTSPSFTVTILTVASKFAPANPLQPNGTNLATSDSSIIPFIQKAAEYGNTIVADEVVSPKAGAAEDDARWYQIDVSSGTPTLADEGNVSAGPNTYILYPAIDINAKGLIGMSYMESGRSGPFLSVYVTARLPGDPAGTMETPVLVQAGAKNLENPGSESRAGDFSGISVDTDGTFWIASEFANTEPIANWGTTIAHFTFFGPTVATATSQSALQGIGHAFDLGSFTDPNPGAVGPWTVTVNWGDGTPNTVFVTTMPGALGSPRHTYAQVGSYTMTVMVTDNLGLVGSATSQVAASYDVTNLNDSGAGSLRQALLEVNSDSGGDQITFAPGLQGAIVLTSSPLSITANMTIAAPGANQIAVSGDNATRVFDIATGVTAEVDGLTITDGMAEEGGGIQNAGTLTLSGDVISDSLATDTGVLGGGGILNLAGATLVLTNSTLSNNVTAVVVTSLGLGGGLDNEGTANVTACTISGNQAMRGGGIENRGTLTVSGSTFTGNRAYGGSAGIGGAVQNRDGGTASFTQCTFTGNMAIGSLSEQGGALANATGCTLTLTAVTVSGNLALGIDGGDGVNTYSEASGGGIINSGGFLNIVDSTISGNLCQAGNGGNNNPDGSGNDDAVGEADGGGLADYGNAPAPIPSGLVISNSLIVGNEAIGGNNAQGLGGLAVGGGILVGSATTGFLYGPDGSSLVISGCTISGNTVLGGTGGPGFRGGLGMGGGIADEGDPMLATDLMVLNNTAIGGAGGAGGWGGTGFGGGISLSFGVSAASLTDSTLSGNQALGGPGVNGGSGEGGAIAVGGAAFYYMRDQSVLTVSGVSISGNSAAGGLGSPGGINGDGRGGGVYAEYEVTVLLENVQIAANRADGGAAASGTGQAGQGLGGGVYIAPGATVSADPLTAIAANFASTNDDDVFGTIVGP